MKKTTLATMTLVALFSFSFYYNNSTPAVTQKTGRIPASVELKTFTFNYKDLSKKSFSIKKQAFSYEDAYKQASKECFKQLTGGSYPGEERGLDIIDICANPKS